MGFNNDPEEALSQLYPQCKFFAVDPEPNGNRELYETRIPGSHFRAAAVAGRSDNGSATAVWSSTKPASQNLEHISLADILREQHQLAENSVSVGGSPDYMVDLLLMDVEGAEFGIIEVLGQEVCLVSIISNKLKILYRSKFQHKDLKDFRLNII